uniref:Peptidase S8/S53 domain-containing protein n=1 Tax=Schistocephalus solidus TaxID=70667 RepID=A0A0V0J5X3_SCHSO
MAFPEAKQTMIPKNEIGALEFLEKFPMYDGRETLIAIWDTGVDPTARGLQVTSDGKPKIIDFIDASGSGDVRMLTTFRITPTERQITTLTGRTVTIPDHWNTKDGIIRVGVKPACELFPSQLMDRVSEETKARCWDPHMKRTSVRVKEALTNHQQGLTVHCATGEKAVSRATETVFATPTGGGSALASALRNCDSRASQYTMYSASSEGLQTPSAACSRSTSPDAAATAVSMLPPEAQPVHTLRDANEGSEVMNVLKDDTTTADKTSTIPKKLLLGGTSDWLESVSVVSLQQIQKVLVALDDNSKFFGPVYDCFVFKGDDGDYVACIDISPYEETPTTLADLPLMKDFSIDRQVSSLGNDTLLYYTVKILDEGRLLQIVTNSGSHGTHVAAIAAAYYPQAGSPPTDTTVVNCNGIAPGAQLVSIKIADTHLAAMETNVALLRAINWTVKLKCDIVNYSFGELSYLPNFGRINQHLTEFVLQHDVAFVASAGNNGPALGTVSSPGGTLEGIIGVAPLVFPEMMEYMYCQPTCPLRSTATTAMTTTSSLEADKIDCIHRPCVSAYTWGSRGPTPDGALGPTVAAPGAAVADIAAWQCNASALLNGSSMSSPAVAGGLALVLSALRQKLPSCDPLRPLRVPFNLWRATIFQTSKQLELLTPLEKGAGIFQVGAALDYLSTLLQSPIPSEPAPIESPALRIEQSRSLSELKPLGPEAVTRRFSGWRLSCSVTGPGCILENNKQAGSRGIWLRRGWLPSVTDPASTLLPEICFKLKIRPLFSSKVSAEFKRILSFHLGIIVGYDGTASPTDRPPWLQVAPFVLVTNRERILPLIIDPNRFTEQTTVSYQKAGKATLSDTAAAVHPPCLPYHTCLNLVNMDSPLRETLGIVPITIQQPLSCFFDYENGVHRLNLRGDFHFASKVCRWFVRIPSGSTGGILHLRRSDADRSASFFTVSVMIPLPLGSVQGTGAETVWNQVPLLSTSAGGVGLMSKLDHAVAYDSTSGTYLFPFAVPWATDTLEVTLAQHWGAEAPDCSVLGSVTFHGLQVEPTRFIFHASQQYFPVSLRSNFGLEEIHWLMKPTNWVLPLKPISSSRSYLSFGDKLDGIGTGLTGAHTLQLEYKFDCPFKCKTVVLSFRRFTALLYDADCLILMYHLYDSLGHYLGAGSYQSDCKPRYTFSLEKSSYTVVAQFLYADSKKIVYDTGDADVLDQLKTYPLLVHFRLPNNLVGSTAAGSGSGQFNLELATSIATLGLDGVDFAKSVAASTAVSVPAGQTGAGEGDAEGQEKAVCNTSRLSNPSPASKKPFLGAFRKFQGLPGCLHAGEVVSEVFGVYEEQFASYAVPESYFEGSVSFYGNQHLRQVVKCPLEIYVGPNPNSATSSSTAASHGRGLYGLTVDNLLTLSPLTEAFFAGYTVLWTPPVKLSKLLVPSSVQPSAKKSSPAAPKKASKPQNPSGKSPAATAEKPKFASLLEALLSADDASTDRHAVWKSANVAMRALIQFVSTEAAEPAPLDAAASLLPVSYTSEDPLEIALFTAASPPPEANTSAMALSESMGEVKVDEKMADDKSGVASLPAGTPAADSSASVELQSTKSSSSPSLPSSTATAPKTTESGTTRVLVSRVQAVECLAVYGRHLCERLIICRRGGGVDAGGAVGAAALHHALRLVQQRLTGLLDPITGSGSDGSSGVAQTSSVTEDDGPWQPPDSLRALLAGRNLDAPFTSADSSRLRVPLALFWIAQAFVFPGGEGELQLTALLVKLAFQV